MNYYNEIDEYAVAWMHELMKAGHLPDGEIDTRPIQEVKPDDTKAFTQCHFFAGIGGWPLAFSLAGWPTDRPVWSGSCPCQPFSAAGKGKGVDDDRHLWPFWHTLIDERRPAAVFGEQVASPAGRAWLDIVSAQMERSDYAFGAADIPASGVGSPQIRQRMWFVGLANTASQAGRSGHGHSGSSEQRRDITADRRTSDRLDDSQRTGLERQSGYVHSGHEPGRIHPHTYRPTSPSGGIDGLADSDGNGCNKARERFTTTGGHGVVGDGGFLFNAGPTSGFWRSVDWLGGRDGKFRPVEPGTFPLANGISNRVDLLRGFGNAISPQVAQEFIETIMELRP